MAGETQLAVVDITTAASQIKSGRVKALGILGKTRSSMAPELPTLNETGLAGYDASGWFGILAPASTPPAIAQRLNAEITAVLRSQEVREKFANAWLEPLPSSQEEMALLIKTETIKWSKVIKDSGATVD